MYFQEISTCDPKYYKGTQQMFLWLFKAGLAYQDEVCTTQTNIVAS